MTPPNGVATVRSIVFIAYIAMHTSTATSESPCVVVAGDLLDGFKFHGPFEGPSQANQWAALHCQGYFEVRDLHFPEDDSLCDLSAP